MFIIYNLPVKLLNQFNQIEPIRTTYVQLVDMQYMGPKGMKDLFDFDPYNRARQPRSETFCKSPFLSLSLSLSACVGGVSISLPFSHTLTQSLSLCLQK